MNTLEINNTVTDFVNKTQTMVLDNLNKVADTVGEQLPNVPVGPADEFLATGAELTDSAFALAGDLLVSQRSFVGGLFDVAKGLLASMSEAEVVEMSATKAA